MTAMRAAWIVCDEKGCDNQHPEDLSGDTIGRAEREVKAMGWRRLPGGLHRCNHHCPVCGATNGGDRVELCTTNSGRDHAARRRQMIANV